jgi:hypothetical protein
MERPIEKVCFAPSTLLNRGCNVLLMANAGGARDSNSAVTSTVALGSQLLEA